MFEITRISCSKEEKVDAVKATHFLVCFADHMIIHVSDANHGQKCFFFQSLALASGHWTICQLSNK